MKRPTARQLDALRILAMHGPQIGRTFAHHFWPGKQWMTGGSRYDASARCGGSMLARLHRAGYTVSYYDRNYGTFAYALSAAGKKALAATEGEEA